MLEYALEKIHVATPTWKTLIISVSRETDVSAVTLWKVWSDINEWKQWSHPLHRSAQWTEGNDWVNNAKFTQSLQLGFPLGETISDEVVEEAEKGKFASWRKREKGIVSCHVWKFEQIPSGNTRITNMEVFDGFLIGLLKPFTGNRWEKLFLASVDGLIAYAKQKKEHL